MSTNVMNINLSPEKARAMLWEKGIVHWILHDCQKSMYDSYHECKEKIVVFNASRRYGKSFCLCVLAIEECLKRPNTIVKYCCAKQIDARSIIRPLIRDILKSCPAHIKPVFKGIDRAWVFPNGSRIELSGLDGGRAESIRGGSAQLAIIDEAGLVGDLKYIIRSIILPTTSTTKGKILLASTPPKSSDHPYIDFLNKARVEGNLITKTIYDNKNIDKEEFDKLVEEYGGEDSVDFRREFLCEVITDQNRAIIPEFDKVLQKKVVMPWKRPAFYDGYVSMDIGFKDLTVALFAYYDFRNEKVVIEDELVLNSQKFTTKALAEGICEKEKSCFSDDFTNEQKPPYMRISDNNLNVIADLYRLHNLLFIPTKKDDKDAALNNMRILLAAEKVIIHPRCVTLIRHLETGTWNKSRTSFDRSQDNGHYDAVDSLKYLIRNVQFGKNPYPSGYGVGSMDNRFMKVDKPVEINRQNFKSILNIKK